MSKTDTTTKLKTKDWEHMSLRLPKEVKDLVYADANKSLRPVGMHVAHIILKYFHQEPIRKANARNKSCACSKV